MMQTPNELLPDGLKMDLLWENAIPASSFAEQTIAINNYSEYKYLMINFGPYGLEYGDKSRNGALSTLIIFNDSKWYYFDRISDVIRYRYVKWNNNVLAFSSGYYIGINYEVPNANNDFAVPYRIWGIN